MLVAVAGITAAVRIIPGIVWPFRGMDAGTHLLLRRHIRGHRMRLTMRDWPLLLDERHTYPWAFHWLIALLPDSVIVRFPPLPSALTDALHAILVALLAVYLSPQVVSGTDPALVGLTAGLLFGSAPALLVVGLGPRAYEVTPRPFGELLFTIVMIGVMSFLLRGSAAALVMSILAGGVLLLSSKFAAQVLVFCVPVVAMVTRDARLLILLPAALAVAMVLSGGRYWWVLKTQVQHLVFYRRRLQHEYEIVASRSSGRNLLRAMLRAVRNPADSGALIEMVRFAEGITWVQFLLRNVLWCGVIWLCLIESFGPWRGAAESWRSWLLAWAIAPVAPFVLTSLRNFRFLGEAERYPEYAIAPVAVLAALGLALSDGHSAVVLVGVYAISLLPVLGYTAARLRWNHHRQMPGAFEDLQQFLQACPASSVMLPLPWPVAFQLMPDLDQRCLVAMDASVWCRDYDLIFARYPWPSTNLGRWRQEFGAELVVVDWVALAKEVEVNYDLSRLVLVHQNDRYRVFAWSGNAVVQ
jgi:hypothetical protein